MTLKEFYIALIEGKKIGHKEWGNEFIQLVDGKIIDEKNIIVDSKLIPNNGIEASLYFLIKENKKLRKAVYKTSDNDFFESNIFLIDLDHFKQWYSGEFIQWVEPGIEI